MNVSFFFFKIIHSIFFLSIWGNRRKQDRDIQLSALFRFSRCSRSFLKKLRFLAGGRRSQPKSYLSVWHKHRRNCLGWSMSYLFEGVFAEAFCKTVPEAHPPSFTLRKLRATYIPWHSNLYRAREDPRIYNLRERPQTLFTELNLTLSHTLLPPLKS